MKSTDEGRQLLPWNLIPLIFSEVAVIDGYSIHDNCELITVTEDSVTEDMQDGLVIDGKLTILNIFNHADMLNPA
jgi:hypothetical protein